MERSIGMVGCNLLDLPGCPCFVCFAAQSKGGRQAAVRACCSVDSALPSACSAAAEGEGHPPMA